MLSVQFTEKTFHAFPKKIVFKYLQSEYGEMSGVNSKLTLWSVMKKISNFSTFMSEKEESLRDSGDVANTLE